MPDPKRARSKALTCKQDCAGVAQSAVREDILSKGPLNDVAEAIRRLDTRVTVQQASLESALVDWFGDVASVCTHVARQCDGLAAHMSQLEVLIRKRDVTQTEAARATLRKDSAAKTEGRCNLHEQVSKMSDCSKIGGGKAAHFRLDDDSIIGSDGTSTDEATEHPQSPKCIRPSHNTAITAMTIGTCGTSIDGLFRGNRYGGSGGARKSWKSVRSMADWMSPAAWVFGSSPPTQARTLNALGTTSRKNGQCKDTGKFEGSVDPSASSRLARISHMSIKLEEEGGAAQLMFGNETSGAMNIHDESAFADAKISDRTPRHYRHTHWATNLVVHDWFTKFCLLVVFLNAAYIGIEANWNSQSKTLYHSPWFYIVMSNVFCTFYVLEWILYFIAFSHPKHAVTQVSHLVDTVLALVTALDTWVLEPLLFCDVLDVSGYFGPHHVVRLVFLARFLRFVKAVPELLTLTRGIVLATRALIWTFAMLAFVTYMFGIVMHTLMYNETAVNAELGERNFATLENAMWTLVIDGALLEEFGDRMTIMLYEYRVKPFFACLSMALYMFMTALTILNMLIGVMNEVVNSLTTLEKTEAAIALMRKTILKQLLKFDDGNGMISRSELDLVMGDAESESVLQSLNVDRLFLLELQQMLFPNEDAQVTISTVVELMLLCRGDNVTTVRTLASGLLYISSLIYKLEAYVNPDSASWRQAPEDRRSRQSYRSGDPIRQSSGNSEESMLPFVRVQAAAYNSEVSTS